MNSLRVEPVAAMIFASDSVDGHRGRPSVPTRLDLLNVVGSRPARFAKAEAETPYLLAIASMADHTLSWLSTALSFEVTNRIP
jgi:hypothetical protein